MAAHTRRVTSKTFAADAQQSADTSSLLVCKSVDVETSVTADRVVTMIISTPARDRDNDSIALDGWDLSSFAKSGVVLWNHDSSQPPIARPLGCYVEGGALKAQCQFATEGTYPMADLVFGLLQQGIVKSCSVGFRPIEYALDEASGGINFYKQELLEFSPVSVPANSQCLIQAVKSAAMSIEPAVEWAREILRQDTVANDKSEASHEVPSVKVELPVVAASPAIEKGGRVLSRANTARLTCALNAMERAAMCHDESVKHLKQMMGSQPESQPGDDGDDDEDMGEGKAVAPTAIEAKSTEAAAPAFDLRLFQQAIEQTVADEIARLRGR